MKKPSVVRTAFLSALIGLVILSPLTGETFRYRFLDGDSYRINSVVNENVYVNRILSHQADITNRMKPRYLAALTYTPVPKTALFRRYQTGEYQLPDAFETLEEMKVMFENIHIDNLTFIGSHASNYLPVSGRLQRDKGKMLKTVEEILRTRNMDALRSDAMRGL